MKKKKNKSKIEIYDIKRESFNKFYVRIMDKKFDLNKLYEKGIFKSISLIIIVFSFVILLKLIIVGLNEKLFNGYFEYIVILFISLFSVLLVLVLFWKLPYILAIPSVFLLLSLIVPIKLYGLMLNMFSVLLVTFIALYLIYTIFRLINKKYENDNLL